jgi:hypothetical protein
MTRRVRLEGSPPSRGGYWGLRAYKAVYREHPDGAQKYRHPVTGDVLEVDAVLSLSMMDRLNSIPGIVVHNVCAGHGLTPRANPCATLGFYTSPALGLWLIQQLGNSRLPYARLSKQPGLYYGNGRWSVHLECRVFSEHINHVRWWELMSSTLEQLVRRYHREQTLPEDDRQRTRPART